MKLGDGFNDPRLAVSKFTCDACDKPVKPDDQIRFQSSDMGGPKQAVGIWVHQDCYQDVEPE